MRQYSNPVFMFFGESAITLLMLLGLILYIIIAALMFLLGSIIIAVKLAISGIGKVFK